MIYKDRILSLVFQLPQENNLVHIARNCPLPIIPAHEKGWILLPSRRVFVKNLSTPNSRAVNMIVEQAQTQNTKSKKRKRRKAKAKRDQTPDPKDSHNKPCSVKSDSSSGSSANSRLKFKPKLVGRPNSSSSGESPILVSRKVLKPNYQWLPKGVPVKSHVSPAIVNIIKVPKDSKIIEGTTPGCKDNWVPKAN